jgi:iron complex outermembrane receptor protein
MKKQHHSSRHTVAFRQWSRKSYAAFNSLKLVVKISVLCAVYTILNPAQETKAQSDSTGVVMKANIDEVEVSGQRAPVVHSQISRIVTVVTKTEIDRAPVTSVNDLLRYVPQVDIRQRGANGAQADISIQGGSFDQTLILLNGINLTDPQTGHYNLTLPFDIESIDRIEVLKGPASRVYGTNAFSGAVNFITGQDTHSYIKASFTGGDFGLYRESMTANLHSDRYTNFISVSKNKSNGYIHNTDYDFTNVYYRGKAQITDNSNVGAQFGYSVKKFGANNFYSPKSADQFDNTDTWFASLDGETGTTIKVKPFVYWRRNYDHYVFIRDNPAYYQNFHFTDVFGGGLNTTYHSELGKTSLGFDYRKEIIYSSSLGTPLTPWKEVPGDTSHYKFTDSRQNISAYLEQNIMVDNFAASVGVMANYNSKLNGLKFYPGMDISYRLNSQVKWYTSVNHSLRLPSFTDLYYKGPQNIGNPDLKPEQAWTLETGLKVGTKGLTGYLSYFHRWGTDIIDWIWLTDVQKWHTVNYTRLNTDGVEIAAQLHPQEMLSKDFFIEQVLLSYSYTLLSKNSDTVRSNYALDNLRHKIALGVNHRIYKKFGATWQLTYQERNGQYGKYDAVAKTTTDTYFKPFWLLDGRVFYQTKWVKIFADVTNIFNANYIDLGNIAQPGRWVKAGVEVNLGI